MRKPIRNAGVERVFAGYPADVRRKLADLRALIFDVASETDGVGKLEETLKWGQPSYLTTESRSGSLIRIDQLKSQPSKYAMYFHCQTTLVDTFREMFPRTFQFEGNRALIFDAASKIPAAQLRECIRLALTYHQKKKAARATRADFRTDRR
jgi:hypothetical protein